ncbi:MAG: hypothetical protein ABII82_11060 [Verrucomicrobiota bacterium]
MRRTTRFILILSILAPLCSEARTWTDIMGRTLEADFIAADETHVTVRRANDRQIFKIELAQLQDIDRDYVLAQNVTRPPTAKPAAKDDETVLTPAADSFQTFQARLKRFRFGKQSMPAKYLGVMSIIERPIGDLPYPVRGLSIGPDGTIVMTAGHGTTARMELVEWTLPGATSRIAPMHFKKFQPDVSKEERARDEKEGRFWFFAGQVAHDRNGEVLMTLGRCSGNGIFRVTASSPTPFQRLNTCTVSSSLQVTSWDNNHAYIANGNVILRFRVSDDSAALKDEVFSIEGEDIYLGNTLMLDREKIIVGLTLPTGEKDSRGVSIAGKFGIYIDRSAGGYYLIHDDYLSAMAVSPDGRRMIRSSRESARKYILTEFALRAN